MAYFSIDKIASRALSVRERFEQMFIPEPNSGCWLWTASLNTKGYGRFSVRHSKPETASRVSWNLYRGDIPAGMLVLHSCDIPSCVNPNHLRVGTSADNMRDAIERKRLPSGCASPHAKLTADQVRRIRAGMRTRDAVREFGGSDSTVRRIRVGQNYLGI